MATVSEVRQGALQLLGILGIGDTASTADDTQMTKRYDELFDDFKFHGMDYWPSAGPVPDRFAPHVEALIAYHSLEDYSVSQPREMKIIRKAGVARKEIRRLGTPDYESLDEPTDY